MDSEKIGGIIKKFEDPAIQRSLLQIKKKVDDASKSFDRRNRVSETTIFLMLLVAIFYDAMQIGVNFIPFVGWVFSFFIGMYAWLTFYIWTSIKGWNAVDSAAKGALKYLAKTRWAARYVLPFIGLIPVVNDIPEITLGVLLTLLIVKSEDFVYNKTKGKVDAETIKQGIEFFNLFRQV